MSIFEETVEKVAHTDDVKLTHLMQQTTDFKGAVWK